MSEATPIRITSLEEVTKKRAARPLGAFREEFEAFWAVYPRRDGKHAAYTIFATHLAKAKDPGVLAAHIIAHVRTMIEHHPSWVEHLAVGEIKFIPHARTYLYQRRYEDQIVQPRPAGKVKQGPTDEEIDAVDVNAVLKRGGTYSTAEMIAITRHRERKRLGLER